MGNTYSMMFPPTPVLTEKNLPDQSGKVFLVTGGASGIGHELVNILYQHNAHIYVAARSAEKANKTISTVQKAHPASKGALTYLHLDLNDLTTIKASADAFLAQASRLDVLWLNAGVMIPPQGSKTAQGYELQLGTNNVAHFLLVQHLHPILTATAKTAPKGSVRLVWVSSSMAEMAPKPAIDFTNMDYKKDEMAYTKYMRSKAGNIIHAAEFARRTEGEGIVSVSLNPGNLRTPLQRHASSVMMLLTGWILYEPVYGAYTELFAGLSPAVSTAQNGKWIQPWGRLVNARKDLLEPGLGKKYWEWTEEQVAPYV